MLSESEIVARLEDAYCEKIEEYHDATRSGSGLEDTIWDKLLLLGEVMGKSEDEIQEDLERSYGEAL